MTRAGEKKRAAFKGIGYIVVWLLVGTFFVAAAHFADSAHSWGREGRWLSGFAFTYALALAAGFAIQIVAALLMLGLTRASRLNGLVHWIGFGAALGAALPWGVARVAYLVEGAHFPHEWQSVKTALMFPLMGAMMYEMHPAWVPAAVGAATGGTVRLILQPFIHQRPRRRSTGEMGTPGT